MGRWLKRSAAAAGTAAALVLAWLCFVWPPPSWWRTHYPAETAFMAMRERQLRAVGDSAPRRYHPVPVDSMSPWLAKAAMAGEDEAFYLHHGVDYHAVREALGYRYPVFSWASARDRAELARALSRAWSRRDRLRGASTITQQLAKNLYLSPSRSPLRKLKEAVIAYRLEWALDKARILELYLDLAEFGRNVWGVDAASRVYFGKSAAGLSLEQAALLAATLPHPLTSNPGYRPARTLWREQLIADKLLGVPVEIPPAETEDTLPPLPVIQLPPIVLDSLALPDTGVAADTPRADTAARKDSQAARGTTPPRSDTAAVPLPRDTTAGKRKKPGGPGHTR